MDPKLIQLKKNALDLVAKIDPDALIETTEECHNCPGRQNCWYESAEAYRAIWEFQQAADVAGVAYDDVPGGHLPEVFPADLTVPQMSLEELKTRREARAAAQNPFAGLFGGLANMGVMVIEISGSALGALFGDESDDDLAETDD